MYIAKPPAANQTANCRRCACSIENPSNRKNAGQNIKNRAGKRSSGLEPNDTCGSHVLKKRSHSAKSIGIMKSSDLATCPGATQNKGTRPATITTRTPHARSHIGDLLTPIKHDWHLQSALYLFVMTKGPIASRRSPDLTKVAIASDGEHTTGSPWRLNDVFNTAPIPVSSSNLEITRWYWGLST